jgi:Uma2 family endonuclease
MIEIGYNVGSPDETGGFQMGVMQSRATLDDLMREPGKAELIGGRIVRFMPTGLRPNQVAAEIFVSLRAYARASGKGVASTDGLGFAVPELSSGRESFSPDAAYYDGPLPPDVMDFIKGPPTFAVEVRSKTDYGPAAEVTITAKRADYFEAGTLVVWDVDPEALTILSYRSDAPDHPTTFGPGDRAHAEPATTGWTIEVDELFV